MAATAPSPVVFAHVLTETFREVSPAKLVVCVAAAVAGIGILIFWAASAGREEKNAKSTYAKNAAHRRWLLRSIAGALLFLGGLAAIPAFAFDRDTRTVPHAETDVPLSTEGTDLPVDFVAGNSDGSVEIKVSNPNEFAVHSQCIIEALDSAGESAAAGTYKHFRTDGTSEESDDYAGWAIVRPKNDVTIEVNLRLDGEVAEYNAACSPIPFTQEQIDQLEAAGIPFQRFTPGEDSGESP